MENKIITRLKGVRDSLQEQRSKLIQEQEDKYAQNVMSLMKYKEEAKDFINNYYKTVIDPVEEIINDLAEGNKIIERINQYRQNLKTIRDELIRQTESQKFEEGLGLIIDKKELQERIDKYYADLLKRLDDLQKDIIEY